MDAAEALEAIDARIRAAREEDDALEDPRARPSQAISPLQKLVGRLVLVEMASGTRKQGRVLSVGASLLETDFGIVNLRNVAYMRVLTEDQRPSDPVGQTRPWRDW
jgi:hypothetical protein